MVKCYPQLQNILFSFFFLFSISYCQFFISSFFFSISLFIYFLYSFMAIKCHPQIQNILNFPFSLQFSTVNFLCFFFLSIFYFLLWLLSVTPNYRTFYFLPHIHILFLLSCESNLRHFMLVYVIVENCFQVESLLVIHSLLN